MKMSPSGATSGVGWFLVLISLLTAVTFSGCAPDSAGDTTTSQETTLATSSTSSDSTGTTSPPVTLSSFQKELANTAKVENALIRQLTAENAAQDDPRMGLVLGLRARMQALSCRQALAEGDLPMARQAMTDVYATTNRGRALAQGEVAQVLAEAHAAIATLGDPSDDPERAAALLDDFIRTLAPLLEVAAGMATTGPATS